MQRTSYVFGLVALVITGWWAHDVWGVVKDDPRVFEWRIYSVVPGRMPALHARFRDHTNALITKHGMTLVGFWNPQGQEAETKLYYLVAHQSKAAAEANWKAFGADPEWKKVREASEQDGKIVEKVDRIWLDPTPYSQMK
jgi:hypothetical protein